MSEKTKTQELKWHEFEQRASDRGFFDCDPNPVMVARIRDEQARAEKLWDAMVMFAEKEGPAFSTKESLDLYLKRVKSNAQALLKEWEKGHE